MQEEFCVQLASKDVPFLYRKVNMVGMEPSTVHLKPTNNAEMCVDDHFHHLPAANCLPSDITEQT